MTFNLLVRRTHIYLALSLLPWFFSYAIGALPFMHRTFFQEFYQDGQPERTVKFDRQYHIPIAEDADLRQVGAQILKDAGMEGSFGVYRPNKEKLNVYLFDFWSSTELTYFVNQSRLLAEDNRFRWDHFLTGLHARGGFDQDSILADSWAVLVDIACLGILIWIASGIYMWWQIRDVRLSGALALSGGLISFLIFLLRL
jgi:hypothetical protein